MKQQYSIGLDIGTSSVGWAVVGEDYRLIRYKHQNMWGSRLFSEAEKAAGRRGFRASRRRLNRRKQRIALLRQFFEPVLGQIDPQFFRRLNESMLHAEDKSPELNLDANILFADKFMTDKEYRQKYPTIYHLRQDLFHTKEQRDIRLVYLALHHIIKYRGNFLVEGTTKQVISSSGSEALNFLFDYLQVEDADIKQDIHDALLNKTLSRSKRVEAAMAVLPFTAATKKRYEWTLKAAIGMKWKAKDLFEDASLEAEGEFSSAGYDEKRDEVLASLGDSAEIVEHLEEVYNWTVFSQFIVPNGCLSDVMMAKYNEYGKDLAGLKRLFKKYSPDRYNFFFRHADKKNTSYATYDAMQGAVPDRKELYKVIVKELTKVVDHHNEDWQRFVERTSYNQEKGTFGDRDDYLARQRIRDNGAIPRQIHQYELETIIGNQARYYPFLAENRDKIIKIHEFRLPYYVGPLNSKSEFAWAKRASGGAVTPWNFDDKIDDIASAEGFIARMRNSCTYLPDEETLAKNSLLYAEYEVRNEIANVRIGSKRLDARTQQRIYDELFIQSHGAVTHKKLLKWITDNQIPCAKGDVSGTANETKFVSSLKALHDFKDNLGIDITPSTYKMVEDIIKWVTLFEDKKILRKIIKRDYGDRISDTQLKRIEKLTYSGWGRLSAKLLDGITAHTQHGEMTIIQAMHEFGKNFMQVAQDEQSAFKQKIDEVGQKNIAGKISYDDIKKLAGSPGIKRALNQAVRIIDEVEDIMGYSPKLISIEMAREEGEKGVRTSTRMKQLEKMYKDLVGNEATYNKTSVLPELKQYEKQLSSRKFYLYFLQNGKCAYSGKSLDIDHLELCEIEHIIPQSLTKDDSIDNTVLVLRNENQNKGKDYPLKPSLIESQRSFWGILQRAGLMSPKKFANLTRERISDDVMGGFIQRQLVETRQITKHLASLLTQQYKTTEQETKVFAIRASMSSTLRQWLDIPKCREINDFHHAKDAYIAVVLAQFIGKRYPKLDKDYLYGEYRQFAANHPKEVRGGDNFILTTLRKEKEGETRVEDIFTKTLRYNDCLVTYRSEFAESQFYNLNLSKHNSGDKMLPRRKGLDVLRYGGYNNEEKGCVVGIRFNEVSRGKDIGLVERIVNVPTYILTAARNSPEALNDYLKQNYQNAVAVTKLLPKRQKIIRGGQEQYVISADEVKNAVQFTLPWDIEWGIAKLLKSGRIIDGMLALPSNMSDDTQARVFAVMDTFFDLYLEKLNTKYPLFSSEYTKLIGLKNIYREATRAQQYDIIRRLLRTVMPMDGMPKMIDAYDSRWKVGFNQKNGQKINLNETKFVFESITGLRKRIVDGDKL